jgi:hypothetical protein
VLNYNFILIKNIGIWEGNIKNNIEGMWCVFVDWIQLAQDKAQQLILVNMAVELLVP